MSTAQDNNNPEDRQVDLTDRASYAYWTADVIRFADLDPLNHVNNVAFSTFFESGRVRFFKDANSPVDSSDGSWMAVRMCVDFRAQLSYPGDVEIGTCVTRIGRSSMTVGAGLFSGDVCAATAECVMVLVDPGTNRPIEVPGHLRQALFSQNPGHTPN